MEKKQDNHKMTAGHSTLSLSDLKRNFETSKHQDLTFESLCKAMEEDGLRTERLNSSPQDLYKPTLGNATQCGNGDFDTGIVDAEWQAATGSINPWIVTNIIEPLSGNLTSPWLASPPSTTHLWVTPGVDPYVAALPRTAPGSNGAIRLGYAIANYRTELLSKTFVVTQPYVCFWYAFVAQASHIIPYTPSFTVIVRDANGTEIPNATDLGGGKNMVTAATPNANTNQLLFPTQDPEIWYKDWTCTQIDLSSQVGNQVTIEFITKGCGGGGHWGYVYIDKFCGDCNGSSGGNFNYNQIKSSSCGHGQICFDFSLPTSTIASTGMSVSGEIQILLGIYQNGFLVSTFDSQKLNSGSSYCFEFDPAQLTGLDFALGGFDFVATAMFTIDALGFGLGQKKIGLVPTGLTDGMNNDYLVTCGTCEEIRAELQAILQKKCGDKQQLLVPCDEKSAFSCEACHNNEIHSHKCIEAEVPEYKPCVSVQWGNSESKCIDSNDVEIMCVRICNCYSNITFESVSIGMITITSSDGSPIPESDGGQPWAVPIPSGGLCFGTIGPCKDGKPTCISLDIAVYTRGAKPGTYKLNFSGLCYTVKHYYNLGVCFEINICDG